MKGQVVVCKEFNGEHIVRVVWETKDGRVFIHSQEQFDKRMAGDNHLEPVGFPVEDVFDHDERLLEQAKREGVAPWGLLMSYNGRNEG